MQFIHNLLPQGKGRSGQVVIFSQEELLTLLSTDRAVDAGLGWMSEEFARGVLHLVLFGGDMFYEGAALSLPTQAYETLRINPPDPLQAVDAIRHMLEKKWRGRIVQGPTTSSSSTTQHWSFERH